MVVWLRTKNSRPRWPQLHNRCALVENHMLACRRQLHTLLHDLRKIIPMAVHPILGTLSSQSLAAQVHCLLSLSLFQLSMFPCFRRAAQSCAERVPLLLRPSPLDLCRRWVPHHSFATFHESQGLNYTPYFNKFFLQPLLLLLLLLTSSNQVAKFPCALSADPSPGGNT